jgi:hypothetical protein
MNELITSTETGHKALEDSLVKRINTLQADHNILEINVSEMSKNYSKTAMMPPRPKHR